jgi:hypothetical protein
MEVDDDDQQRRRRRDEDAQVDNLFVEPELEFPFSTQDELLDTMINHLTNNTGGQVPFVFIVNRGDGEFHYHWKADPKGMASYLFMVLARHLISNKKRLINCEWASMFLAMAQAPVNYFSYAGERELECSRESRVWQHTAQAIEIFFGNTQHPVSLILYQDPLGHILLRYCNMTNDRIEFFSFIETVFKHIDFVRRECNVDALQNELESSAPQDNLAQMDAFLDSDDENDDDEDENAQLPGWKAMQEIKPKFLDLFKAAASQ